jgi:hypothetical protein
MNWLSSWLRAIGSNLSPSSRMNVRCRRPGVAWRSVSAVSMFARAVALRRAAVVSTPEGVALFEKNSPPYRSRASPSVSRNVPITLRPV